MLVELSVMEQRYQAVLAVVQDGWKVTEVAAGSASRARACTPGSPVTSREGSRRSRTARTGRAGCPHQTRAEIEAQSASCVGSTPVGGRDGSSTSSPALGLEPVPVRSSIYRCLKRHGLVELRRRRKRRDEFRRWERDRPMQLWQMDVMGGVELGRRDRVARS